MHTVTFGKCGAKSWCRTPKKERKHARWIVAGYVGQAAFIGLLTILGVQAFFEKPRSADAHWWLDAMILVGLILVAFALRAARSAHRTKTKSELASSFLYLGLGSIIVLGGLAQGHEKMAPYESAKIGLEMFLLFSGPLEAGLRGRRRQRREARRT